MRISPAKCVLVVLPMAILVGCKSGGSTWYRPTWSLSKLNPFSSSSDKAGYPAKPSSLASPTPTMSPAAGYATAGPNAAEQSAYPDRSATGYPSPQYPYPSTSTTSLAGDRAASPQNGYYNPRVGAQIGGQSSTSSSGSQYSWNTGTDAYGPSGQSGYGSANSQYQNQTAGASGSSGYAATAAPRYEIPSDRYGSNAAGSGGLNDLGGRQGTAPDPYASVREHNSQYTNNLQGPAAGSGYGATAGSTYGRDVNSAGASDYRYGTASPANGNLGASTAVDTGDSGSRYNSASRYGTGASSTVDDRYARANFDRAGTGYNSYENGHLSNSPGNTDWTPGNTGYQPGGPTDNMPGQTDYQPGQTGYNPPGVSQYRSPADSYTPPSDTADDEAVPYLPGSTRLSTPRNTGLSDTPEQYSPASDRPQTDSQVVPAGHTPAATGIWR